MPGPIPSQTLDGRAPEGGQSETVYNPQYQPQYNNHVPKEVLEFERYSVLLNNSMSAPPGDQNLKGYNVPTGAGGFPQKNYGGVFAKARYSSIK